MCALKLLIRALGKVKIPVHYRNQNELLDLYVIEGEKPKFDRKRVVVENTLRENQSY